jgi:hypothetical protein
MLLLRLLLLRLLLLQLLARGLPAWAARLPDPLWAADVAAGPIECLIVSAERADEAL